MSFIQKITCASIIGAGMFFLGALPALAAPMVAILTPNGGETLTVGQTYRIKWNSTNTDTVTLGYSSCASCLDWIANNIPNTGSYDWTVNVGNTTNTQFKIYITAYQTGVGSASDYSDANFTVGQSTPAPIITSIDSTGSISPGVRVVVNGLNFDQNVLVAFDGSSATAVSPVSVSATSLVFIVPLNTSIGTHTVQVVREGPGGAVSNSVSLNVVAASPSPTPSSSGSVTLLSPNGGEVLTSGTTYDIRYTSSYPSNNEPETGIALYQGNTLLGYPVYTWISPDVLRWNVSQYTVNGSGAAQTAPAGYNYFMKVYMAGGLQDTSNAPFGIVSSSSSAQPVVGVSSRVVGTTQDGTEVDYTFTPGSAVNWLITVACTSPVTATTKGGGDCGETVGFSFTASPVLPFWFKNPTNTYQTVGIKASAYDANGILMGSDSDSVSIPPTASVGVEFKIPSSLFPNQTSNLLQLQQKIAALQQQLAQLQTQQQSGSGNSSNSAPTSSGNQEGDTAPATATVSFDHDLSFGMRNNEDVSNLQEFLIDQGFLKGAASGNYFILTQSAVKRFQAAHNVRASGYFGPVTRGIANKILAGK